MQDILKNVEFGVLKGDYFSPMVKLTVKKVLQLQKVNTNSAIFIKNSRFHDDS